MDIERQALQPIEEAVARFGTPLYLYDQQKIEQNIRRLRDHLGTFRIRYAVKTNPNPWLLEWLKERVDSLDVSSAGELKKALAHNWSGSDLAFTGPAKKRRDLELALETATGSVVVEDISEARWLNELAAQRNRRARILLRIAPAKAENKFGVRLAGRPTQFGVDEEKLPEFFSQLRELPHLHLDGFHIYSGSQCLDDEALAEHFLQVWNVFKQAISQFGQPISELVFGAGMGIPFHDGDASLTLSQLPAALTQIEAEIAQLDYPITSYIELGRFIVGTAGLFVTQVVRVKESMGNLIAICDGGMNNNLGACGHMGGISHRHYSMARVSERETTTRRYRVVGPLCTAIDTLAHRIDLPELQSGDLLAVGCAGSYGPTASPLFFIAHDLPHEVVVDTSATPPRMIDVSWLPNATGE